MLGDKVLQPISETGVGGMLAERATIKQRLIRQQVELQTRLKQVNDALDAMDKQPEVAQLLELVMKAM